MDSLRAHPAFAAVVLLTLGVFGVIGVMLLLMQLQPGFMGMAHGTEPHHRVHDLTFGFLLSPVVVGLLAQLRTPSRNVAGQLTALVPWIALLLAFLLATTWLVFAPAPLLGALTLLAAILHPARHDFIRSVSVARVHRVMLVLVIIAAVPLIVLASTNIGLQRTLTNDHAALGHYGFMAAFSFTVIGLGLLASVRPAGWGLTAWLAGLLPALLGLASLAYPDNDSSLDLVWALAAIAWGVVFIAAAMLIRARGAPGLLGPEGAERNAPDEDIHIAEPDRGPAPRWVKLAAMILLLLVLALVIMLLAGEPGHGPARHMQP